MNLDWFSKGYVHVLYLVRGTSEEESSTLRQGRRGLAKTLLLTLD